MFKKLQFFIFIEVGIDNILKILIGHKTCERREGSICFRYLLAWFLGLKALIYLGRKYGLSVELVGVMQVFSREYTRQRELGIEEMSLKEILDSVKCLSEKKIEDQWKIEAFIGI